MRDGRLETVRAPRNVLDVLAQQVVAMCVDAPRSPPEVGALVRRALPYRELSDGALTAVLEMLSGNYPSTEFADLRPRLSWDRAGDRLSARRGTAMVSRVVPG